MSLLKRDRLRKISSQTDAYTGFSARASQPLRRRLTLPTLRPYPCNLS